LAHVFLIRHYLKAKYTILKKITWLEHPSSVMHDYSRRKPQNIQNLSSALLALGKAYKTFLSKEKVRKFGDSIE